ncbi:transducin beta-like protein 3 [Corticium candelabrum]|uniref:transducin beta-like protein 3 n=1 Tax=Corticium candelabrum TaxID=121492 RepID=UPI002E262697|nr:transducin beta-like protein 3 [Corticium candelabrum]
MSLKKEFVAVEMRDAFFTGGSVLSIGCTSELICQNGSVMSVLDIECERVVRDLGKSDQEDGTDPILCFAVSPDGKRVVAAYRSFLLKQFDVENGKCERQWKAYTGPASSIAFDSSSTLVASGFTDGLVRVWDCIQCYWTHHLRGSRGRVSLSQFHPMQMRHMLYTAADDYVIRAWDLKSSQCITVFEAHSSSVTAISLSISGNKLVSSGRDKMIHIWNTRNGQLKNSIPVMEQIEACLVVPHTLRLPGMDAACLTELQFVVCGENGKLSVWQSDGKCLFSQQSLKDGAFVTQLLPLLQHGKIVTVTFDHRILVWNLDFSLCKQFVGFSDEILDVACVHNGQLAVVSNSNNVRISSLGSLGVKLLTGHRDTVLGLDVSRDGSLIATCSKDNTVRVWKLNQSIDYLCIGEGVGHTRPVGCVSISKSCWFLVSGSEDFTLKHWDAKSLEKLLENSPKKLVCSWTQKAHDKAINTVAVSPNDKLIATGSQDRTAKVWSSTGSLVNTLRGHKRGVWCVCFSPVDKCLATCSGDMTIKIWSLTDAVCVKTLEGHSQSVLRVLFISNGMQLVSCGSDGLIKLWNVKNNECVATLDKHIGKVWALAVTEDGDFVVSGGSDSLLVVWKDCTKESEDQKRMDIEIETQQEQELINLLQKKDYSQAVRLSLSLGQPRRLFSVVSSIVDSLDGKTELAKFVGSLAKDQLDQLISYTVTWNMNSKSSRVSQSLLHLILCTINPDTLMELPSMKGNLESLLPYTERHMSRTARMMQQAMFVDYTWQMMRSGIVESVFAEGAIEQGNEMSQWTEDDHDELITESRCDEEKQATSAVLGVSSNASEVIGKDTTDEHQNTVAKLTRKKTRRARKQHDYDTSTCTDFSSLQKSKRLRIKTDD